MSTMLRSRGIMAKRKAVSSAVQIAPAADQPVITVAACGASVTHSPTIGASSVGFAREKRIGTAESAPGVDQSASGLLDILNSTHYRFPLMDSSFVVNTASNATKYVSSAYKPGSSSTVTNSMYQFNFEFVTSSPVVAIKMNAVATNARLGRVYVNGALLSKTVPILPVNAGTGYEVVFTFPAAGVRTIKIIGFNQDEGRFAGVDVASGYSVVKPTTPVDPIIMFTGDSYVQGAQGVSSLDTWIWEFAESLGFTNIMADGVGSTGFVTDTGGLTNNYSTRTADIAKIKPQTLVIAGGRNDGSSTAVQAALEAILDAAVSIPNVYVVTTGADTQTVVNNQLSAGAAGRNRAYIGGFSIDAIPKGADNVHMTAAGHLQYAQAALLRVPVVPWLNHAIVLKNTGSNTGAVYNFGFTPKAGSLLVVAALGPVNWTTLPAGWTLRGQQLNSGGIFLLTKTAAITDVSFTASQNGTGQAAFPTYLEVWEFPAGSTFSGFAGGHLNSTTTAMPTVTGLSGKNLVFWNVIGQFGTQPPSDYVGTFTPGTPLVNLKQLGTTDSSILMTQYLDGVVSSSTPAASESINSAGTAIATGELATWAVKLAA